MRILIATDAWEPQVNGVVQTLRMTAERARALNVDIRFLHPQAFPAVPLPGYRELRLALPHPAKIARLIEEAAPDAIHIATEGPIGLLARRYCRRHGLRFTSSFHTRFPDYVSARYPVPESVVWAALRWFHGASASVMAATPALRQELRGRGFRHVTLWPRGVDSHLFHPERRAALDLLRPIFLSVGRVAIEKNLDAFLSLDLPGTRIVVGDGPDLKRLQQAYPDVIFTGAKFGAELAGYYAAADVFVFPSRTDTYGLVLLEALASGTPVAAFPVCGPRDVIGDAPVGALSEDLRAACLAALSLSRDACRAFALKRDWDASCRAFLSNSVPARPGTVTAHLPAAIRP